MDTNKEGKIVKLNIGCGFDYKEGFVNIDSNKNLKTDLLLDVDSAKLPFEDNSVEFVFCSHVLEHMHYPEKLLQEIERVLIPEKTACIVLPSWNNPIHIGDLTHRNHANSQTFDEEKQLWNYLTHFEIVKITAATKWGTIMNHVPIRILERIGWPIYDYWFYLKKKSGQETQQK